MFDELPAVQTLERSYLLRVNGVVVERPQHQLPELARLEVLLLLKSQPPRKKRRKKVGYMPKLSGICSHPIRKGRIR